MSVVAGRALMGPDPDMRGYRKMTMGAASTLAKAAASGKSASMLARELGVSRRTIYRWRHATFHTADVAGWRATFVVRPDRAEAGVPYPIQITPWQPIEEASA